MGQRRQLAASVRQTPRARMSRARPRHRAAGLARATCACRRPRPSAGPRASRRAGQSESSGRIVESMSSSKERSFGLMAWSRVSRAAGAGRAPAGAPRAGRVTRASMTASSSCDPADRWAASVVTNALALRARPTEISSFHIGTPGALSRVSNGTISSCSADTQRHNRARRQSETAGQCRPCAFAMRGRVASAVVAAAESGRSRVATF